MRNLKLIVLILTVFFSGCLTTSTSDNEVSAHVLAIDRDGCLETIKLNGCENPDATKTKAYFENILEKISEYPRNEDNEIEVLIYVHGGLNSEKDALKRTVNEYKKIRCLEKDIQEGIKCDKKQRKYPVFINWRSGPLTTYGAHLGRIRQGEISNTAIFTSPIYLISDIGNSLTNAPKAWIVTGEHSVNSIHLKDYYSSLNKYNPEKNGVLFTGNSEDYSSWSQSLLWAATSPFKIVTTPFTYTMAKPAWDVMLRRTNTVFYKSSDFNRSNSQISAGGKNPTGAFFEFLFALSERSKTMPIKITFMGHSMGAIVVNEAINNLGHDLPVKNIVHMASADSTRNLFDQIVPFLSGTPNTHFYSLHLHPENEDREISAWGLTPSGSLLVWIDDMFTTPETILDKRSGRWDNIERVIHLIPDSARDQMHFKIFGLKNKDKKVPQTHGAFDDIPLFWTQQVWWQ